jgi:hypothetical protein
MRTCKKCLVNKELIEFKKHSNGHRHTCKKCQYAMEMENPIAHANRIARMQRYRDSEQGKEKAKQYESSPQGKENRKNAVKKYENTLAGYLNKRTTVAKRRAARIQRTPSWLTDFDKLKIKCMYSIATMLTRENKEEWTVDHIIPLQGKLASGLHVPNNLQVMRGSENYSKINKFEVSA